MKGKYQYLGISAIVISDIAALKNISKSLRFKVAQKRATLNRFCRMGERRCFDLGKRNPKNEQIYTKENLKSEALRVLYQLSLGAQRELVRMMFSEQELSEDVLKKMDVSSISEVKKTKDGGVEIKFFDRFKALELLLKLVREEDERSSFRQFYQALIHSDQQEEESGI